MDSLGVNGIKGFRGSGLGIFRLCVLRVVASRFLFESLCGAILE